MKDLKTVGTQLTGQRKRRRCTSTRPSGSWSELDDTRSQGVQVASDGARDVWIHGGVAGASTWERERGRTRERA